MSEQKKSANTTHRKRLARALAEQTGLSYAQSLNRVVDAAEKGLLPRRLDEAGMAAALRVLSNGRTASPFSRAARLLGGPYTTHVYVFDVGTEVQEQMPRCVLCDRQVPDGGQWWLVSDPDQGWANDTGCVCDAHDAKALRVHSEGLIPEEYVAGRFPQQRSRHRTPYVGEGADGARRSAQIDREEAEMLPTGPHQPGWNPDIEERRAHLLASAEAWESQAAHQALGHADAETTARHYIGPDDRPDDERLHLEKSSLALLRQVWQGRVAWQRHGVRKPTFRFTIDDQPASDIKDIELRWLRDHDYITTPPLADGDEWAVARTTEFGDEVLAFHGADTHRFYDGLPSAWMVRGEKADGQG